MIQISPRPCTLGSSINTRTEKHGDEDVPACDIPLAGIVLNAEELGALIGEPLAAQILFTDRGGHKEPVFTTIESLRLKGRVKEASVSIEAINVESARLKSLCLTPQSGGATLLSCKVQLSGDEVPSIVGSLLERLGQDVTVAMSIGELQTSASDKQAELPINDFGDGEEGE